MELSNILRIDNFYTQKKYTKAYTISRNTAGNRIKSGRVATLTIDGQLLIHIEASALTAQFKPNTEHKPIAPALPANINKDNLVHISSYSRKKGITADKFYKAILTEKIFGLIIAEEVFAYKQELENF